MHGALWQVGHKTDLGTLGGPNSTVAGFDHNTRGVIPGISETSPTDPYAENWCGFGTSHLCQGFRWRNGVMTPLPTLGGNNGVAFDVNNRGQVIGYSRNQYPRPKLPGAASLRLLWCDLGAERHRPSLCLRTPAISSLMQSQSTRTGRSSALPVYAICERALRRRFTPCFGRLARRSTSVTWAAAKATSEMTSITVGRSWAGQTFPEIRPSTLSSGKTA